MLDTANAIHDRSISFISIYGIIAMITGINAAFIQLLPFSIIARKYKIIN